MAMILNRSFYARLGKLIVIPMVLSGAAMADQPLQFTLRFGDGQPVDASPSDETVEQVPAPPDSTDGFTLDQAESIALSQHPALAAANAEVRAARGRWLQVGLPPNPKVGYMGEEIGNQGSAGIQGGFVSQEFVTGGKLRLGREVAERQVAQANRRLAQTELRVLTQVRSSFYKALVAQQSVAVAGRIREVAQKGIDTADQLLRAQEGTKVGVLQGRIQLQSAEILVVQARNRQDAARRALAAAIGAPESLPADLSGNLDHSLPEFDWQVTMDRLLMESPELAELEIDIERARWSVASAQAQWIPNVTVQTGVGYADPVDNTVATVNVSVPLPIFDRNQGNIAAARSEVSAARGSVLNKQLELQRRLASTFAQFQTSREQVRKYKQSILPSASESLDLVQNAYAQGELSYLDFLNSQRVYLQTNLEYLTSLGKFWDNWAEIEGLVINVPAQ